MNNSKTPVLITGASQGIGRAIALSFAEKTDRPLILLARNTKNLEKSASMCMKAGVKSCFIISADATNSSEMASLRLPDGCDAPGIIINNAGSFLLKSLSDTTPEEFMHQINVNLFAAVNTTSRFLPDLRKMESALIINICSVGALSGLKDSGAYSASKHAVLGYTRSLRKELMGTNIAVSAINLGQTHSTSWDGSSVNPGSLIDPFDVGSLLVAISSLSTRSVVEEVLIQPLHGKVPPM